MAFVIDMIISDDILQIDCSANFMDDTLSFTHSNGLISYYDYSGIILNDISKNTLLNIDKLSFNNDNNLASYSKNNINISNKNNIINIDTSGIIIEQNKNVINFTKGYSINNISNNGFIEFDIDFINKIPVDTLPVVVINQESNDIVPLIITSITNNGFYWKSAATGPNIINYIASIIDLSNSTIQTNTKSINDVSDNGYIQFNNDFINIPVLIISQESEGDIVPLNITSVTNNGFYWKSAATGVNKINYYASIIDLSNLTIQTDIVNINDSSDNGYIQFNIPLMSPIVLINRISNEDIIYLVITSITNDGFYWKSSATGVKQINYNAYSVMNTLILNQNNLLFDDKHGNNSYYTKTGIYLNNISNSTEITTDHLLFNNNINSTEINVNNLSFNNGNKNALYSQNITLSDYKPGSVTQNYKYFIEKENDINILYSLDYKLIISSYNYLNSTGIVYIYDNQLNLIKTIIGENEGDKYGYKIAFLNNKLLVSAPQYSGNTGKIYIYDSNFNLEKTMVGPNFNMQYGTNLVASPKSFLVTETDYSYTPSFDPNRPRPIPVIISSTIYLYDNSYNLINSILLNIQFSNGTILFSPNFTQIVIYNGDIINIYDSSLNILTSISGNKLIYSPDSSVFLINDIYNSITFDIIYSITNNQDKGKINNYLFINSTTFLVSYDTGIIDIYNTTLNINPYKTLQGETSGYGKIIKYLSDKSVTIVNDITYSENTGKIYFYDSNFNLDCSIIGPISGESYGNYIYAPKSDNIMIASSNFIYLYRYTTTLLDGIITFNIIPEERPNNTIDISNIIITQPDGTGHLNSKSLKLLDNSNNGVTIENINGNGSITLDNNSTINVNGSTGSNGQFLMSGINSLQWANPFKTYVINNITTLTGSVLFDASYTFINPPFIIATTVSNDGYYVGVSISSIKLNGFKWLLTSLNIIQINVLLIGN